MKKVTTYIRDGRKFEIVKDKRNGEWWYMAIEEKYIDDDGKLNTPLNGLQMSASRTMEQCIELTTKRVDYEAYIAEGMSKAEAYAEAWNLPVWMVEEMFK